MRNLVFTAFLAVMTVSVKGQPRPVLTLDKEIGAKLDTVHAAMNSLVKAFGKNPSKESEYRTKYQTDFKAGKAFVRLSEDKEQEKLELDFSSIYYDGTSEQFVRFYNDVVKRFGEMLAATHTLQPQTTKPNNYQSIFYEKGTGVMNSRSSVFIEYSTISGKFPHVMLYIYHKKV